MLPDKRKRDAATQEETMSEQINYTAIRVFICKIGEVVREWSKPGEDFDQFYERVKPIRISFRNVRIEEGQLMTVVRVNNAA